MNYKELRAKSMEIANQARALLDTITAENRSDKEAEFDRMMVDSDAFAARADKLEEADKRSASWSAIDTNIASETVEVEARASASTDEQRAADFANYLRSGLVTSELRAQTVGTGSEGGFTVSTDFDSNLVKVVKRFGPLNEGGPAKLLVTSQGNPLTFAKLDDTSNVGSLIGEAATVSDTALAFTQLTLGAYKYTSGLFKVSRELLEDSAINIVEEVASAAGERIGRAINIAYTTGTGSAQPQGVVTGATAGVTAASASLIAYDELINLEHSVDPAYRDQATYMFNDSTLLALRKLKNAVTGDYVWTPANGTLAPMINGKRYFVNTAMANIATGNKTVLFGDFSKFTIRKVKDVIVRRLDERFADTDQVAFVAFYRTDSKVMDGTAIKYLVQA